jgi:hypothetical protein
VSLHEGVWVHLDKDAEDWAGSVNLLTGTEGTGPERSCIMHGVPVQVESGSPDGGGS